MRTPSLKIKKFTKRGFTFYGIHVPSYLNASGKSGYYYYHTKAEAERGRVDIVRCMTSEKTIHILSNAQQADALRALELLQSHGFSASLTEAVELALPLLATSGRNVTTESLCSAFTEAKASSWSAASARNFRNVSSLFLERFGGMAISSISARDLQAWFEERFVNPGYRLNAIRTLRPAFNFAVRQDMLVESPFEKLEAVRANKRDGIDIFTPEEARRIMDTVPADCIAAYALLLFAGVRPQELTRLTWENVRDGFVHITPAIAKTGQVRNIEIEPTLAAWLASTGHHSPDEPICPTNWKRKNQAARAAAGIANRQDTARHSYATYHLALHRDTELLKANLGHSRGSDILFVHYRAAATPADAERYWSILPNVK